ncbi:MAG: dihydrolipoyl dehydrogenase [Bacillota bacterium]|nr:dihydrolipoyl dehydrogenase [Bacillota bacterium]
MTTTTTATNCDLIVLGGGPGGYLAAERAGQAGLSVVLFEKNRLGGVCLNEGCIPSKTLLHSAKVFDHAKNGTPFGVTADNAKLDQPAVIRRKDRVVRRLVAGVGQTLKNAGVTVVNATATITGRQNGRVTVSADGADYEAPNLIIATGSEAVRLPLPGIAEGLAAGRVLTNREVLDLTVIPEHLVVIGGGVIGLEMADYFHTAGSEVTVIEMLDHIAGPADPGLALALQQSFERAGIRFALGARVTAVEPDAVVYSQNGETRRAPATHVLLSVGRRAVTAGFGLETIGVSTERGRIPVDDRCRTNVAGVYAVGDVTGEWMLAHAAYREAEVAVATILGRPDRMDYAAMPSVLYTRPELAWVGLSENEAIARGITTRTASLPFAYAGRFVAETERSPGEAKFIFDERRRTLVGCHLLGSYASEIITSAGLLIGTGLPVEQMKRQIVPHPTVAEIIREAIWHAWPETR